MRVWSSALLLTALFASTACGGGEPEEANDPDKTNSSVACANSCDDGDFCNGRELCAPGNPDADDDGCVGGHIPCAAEMCIEDRDICLGLSGSSNADDIDGDGHESIESGGDDCDDYDSARFPGNLEFCDPLHHDEDCDPMTHGGKDQDHDDFMDSACCNKSEEGELLCGDDCDGDLAWVYPGAPELCDGRDNDCDGMTDEDSPTELWFPDEDGDGFGAFAGAIQACGQPEGYIALPGDCNDTDGTIFPGAPELCDGLFNDCQHVDGGRLRPSEDSDNDGYAPIGADCEGGWPKTDCADNSSLVHPGTGEAACDCSGTVDVAQCGNVVCEDGEKLVTGSCQTCGEVLISAQSPLVHWRFEDPESGVMLDSSGNGHDGVITEGRNFPGLAGGGFFTGDYLGNDPDAPGAAAGASWRPADNMPTDEFSVTFWVRHSQALRDERIKAYFGYGVGTTGVNTNHFMLHEVEGELQATFPATGGSSGTCTANSIHPLPSHVGWQHFAVTYDSSAESPVTVYIDGEAIELAMPTSCKGLPLTVGRGALAIAQEMDDLYCAGASGTCSVSLDPKQRFSGVLDEFAIFEQVLSAETIQDMNLRTSCVDAEDCRGETFPNGCRAPKTCVEALHTLKENRDDPLWLDADGPAAGSAPPTSERCVQDKDGGGWTLMARYANDAQPTWSFNNQAYFTDDTIFGSAIDVALDFKSPRTQTDLHEDWLFIHRPSGLWASYNIGEGTARTFVEHMDAHLIPETMTCYGNPPVGGIPMVSGNIDDSQRLCSTNLFFSPGAEGAASPCLTSAYNQHAAFGPAWSGHREGEEGNCSASTSGGGLGPIAYLYFHPAESGGSGFATYYDLERNGDAMEQYAR